jgi:hypothetical protein
MITRFDEIAPLISLRLSIICFMLDLVYFVSLILCR